MFVNFCLIWNCSPAQHHLLRFGQNKTRTNTLTPIVNKCNTKCVPSSVNQIKESTEQLDVILKTPFLIFTFLLELMKTSVLVKVMLNIPKFSLASLSSKLFLKWETNKRLNVLKKRKEKTIFVKFSSWLSGNRVYGNSVGLKWCCRRCCCHIRWQAWSEGSDDDEDIAPHLTWEIYSAHKWYN